MGLDLVELFMAVEERFDVDIPNEEAETLLTIGSLHEWLVSHRADSKDPRTQEMTPDRIWAELVRIVEEQTGVTSRRFTPNELVILMV
jgi:hypothetical protein